MSRKLGIQAFLREKESPMLDVRSPGEYLSGHIPGAISFPLFSDEERATVGTLYKQTGKEASVIRGLELIGPRLAGMVRQAYELAGVAKKVRVYCWRGGMRSGSVAWLLHTCGLQVEILEGGYKSWRNYLPLLYAIPFEYQVLGGYTGSGKTEILYALKQSGAQVLDLEFLASHKGSAFGAIGMAPQPSQEHFENLLGQVLMNLDVSRPLWVEDESRMIGRITLPEAFWVRKSAGQVYFIEVPKSERIQRLVKDYTNCPAEMLKDAILRIQKKLGGVRTQEALEALAKGELETVADLTLYYYDKAYNTGLNTLKKPEQVTYVSCTGTPEERLKALPVTF
jgi:tRNA 2-selenouridine synthase